MGVSEVRRLKQLEEENAKPKRLVVDISLDETMLQDALQKMVKPVWRREVVRHFQVAFAVWERRASGFGRASHRYKSRRDPAPVLRMRLKDLAASRVRYRYRLLHVLLQREGRVINHKHVYRLYSEEGLSIHTAQPEAPSVIAVPAGSGRGMPTRSGRWTSCRNAQADGAQVAASP